MNASSRMWLLLGVLASCTAEVEVIGSDEVGSGGDEDSAEVGTIAAVNKMARYAAIRNAASARGLRNAYLLAGIANDETNLAHCWSEATWACQGPSSPDCGGGPVIAGSADGPCSAQQGGLGMFQFDAGTFSQTLARYGNDVLTIDGQIRNAIDYSTNMVKISVYTTNAETDDKARAWLNNYDPNNATLRNQWISTVVRYYNGCQPGWSCWGPRYQTYSDGYFAAINDPGGLGFWGTPARRCNGSPPTVGSIDAKYRALGGCTSVLGHPITSEQTRPTASVDTASSSAARSTGRADRRVRGSRRHPRQVEGARLGGRLRLPDHRRDADARRRRTLQRVPGRLDLLVADDRRTRGARPHSRQVRRGWLGGRRTRIPDLRRVRRHRRTSERLRARLDHLDLSNRYQHRRSRPVTGDTMIRKSSLARALFVHVRPRDRLYRVVRLRHDGDRHGHR